MAIRPDEVRHVAGLARLELGEDEVERVAAELTAVLEYAAVLRRLDDGAAAPAPAAAGPSRLREDETAAPLAADDALAMAPESEGGFFVVPAFVESPEP
jgi:aspartyl-tRNA(Asn)/glutamyl-tRNA(Gln) amidotransferase subunit C